MELDTLIFLLKFFLFSQFIKYLTFIGKVLSSLICARRSLFLYRQESSYKRREFVDSVLILHRIITCHSNLNTSWNKSNYLTYFNTNPPDGNSYLSSPNPRESSDWWGYKRNQYSLYSLFRYFKYLSKMVCLAEEALDIDSLKSIIAEIFFWYSATILNCSSIEGTGISNSS